MTTKLLAAAVQLTSTADVARNLLRCQELIRHAASRGARLVVLPENFAIMSASEEQRRAAAERLDPVQPGPIVSAMAEVAAATGVHLVLGGMPEIPADGDDKGRFHNACVLLGPDGGLLAVYRKIHLFDVFIPDGVTYAESRSVAPGDRPVVADTPWGGLGLSVCYDVRFPELYRALAAEGARIVVVPAAFTLHTGRDHWHPLLRARAIENQVFVVAAAQYGKHDEKRVTFGHSLIVDPWGTVIADHPDGEGVVVAELDFDRQDAVRRDLPALQHRRL